MKKINIISGCSQIAMFIIIMGIGVYQNGMAATITSITDNIDSIIFYGTGVFFIFRDKHLLAFAALIVALLLAMC